MKNEMLPNYLSVNLSYVRDVQPYELRSNNLFRLPSYSVNAVRNSIFHKGLQLYNYLQQRIQVTNSVNEFK